MHSCSIYCRVIDNFGDAGIAWRLARTLVTEKAWQVTLVIDNIDTLSKFVPEIDTTRVEQQVYGIRVVLWDDLHEKGPFLDVSDVTIEAFSCFLPEALEAAIARETEKKLCAVIALDYLTAETYAEQSHGLTSPHPRYGYRKEFFFPGFTEKTGGLLREANLAAYQKDFHARHGRERVLNAIGADPKAFTLFFFTYPTIPIADFAKELASDPRPLQVIAAPGDASDSLKKELLQLQAHQIRYVQAPMYPQSQFDDILLACDVALVRGEDSTVRAQLCATPLIWTLYPQSEETHLVKLTAFSHLYREKLPETAANIWETLTVGLNSEALPSGAWKHYRDAITELKEGAKAWQKYLFSSSTLTERLCAMAEAQLQDKNSF